MITASGADNSSDAGARVMPQLPVIADTKGRVRVTKAQRRDILAALARSGESLPRFARRIGLKYSTLARWVQVSRAKPAGRKPALRLLEAMVESAPVAAAGTVLVLPLPGNVRLEVADEQQAALAAILLRGLAKSC